MEGLLQSLPPPRSPAKTHCRVRISLSIPHNGKLTAPVFENSVSTSRDSREGALALVTWLNGLNAIRRRWDRYALILTCIGSAAQRRLKTVKTRACLRNRMLRPNHTVRRSHWTSRSPLHSPPLPRQSDE